jgi:uncharacterized protein (DUF3084 family)
MPSHFAFQRSNANDGGAEEMITTEEAERLLELGKVVPDGFRRVAAAISTLAAERDALRQERDALQADVKRLGAACNNYQRQVSLMQMRHARHLPALETRIARQRRALAKLYRKRHDRKAERDYLEKTAMQAAQCHGRETLRADKLQAENARLREAIEMAIDCIQDNDVIGARLTLTKTLGETQ